MLRFGSMVATVALLLSADVPGVNHLRPPTTQPVEFPSSENLPVLPDMSPAKDQDQATQDKSPAKSDKNGVKSKDQPLQPESRLALVRYVDGELARVVEPLPAGKKGFHLKAGAPFDEKQLRMALGFSRSALNPGDRAQITSLEFKEREIIVDLNGGGRGKQRLRDRIHLEIGDMPTMIEAAPDAPVDTNAGATIFLDFDNPVPEMTPDELKQDLSALLDFRSSIPRPYNGWTLFPPTYRRPFRISGPR